MEKLRQDLLHRVHARRSVFEAAFEIVDDARRRSEEVASQRGRADAPARGIGIEQQMNRATAPAMDGLKRPAQAGAGAAADPTLGLEHGQGAAQALPLAGGQRGAGPLHAELRREGARNGFLDRGRLRHVAEFGTHGGYALAQGIDFVRIELLHRHAQRLQHGLDVQIHQQRALKQKRRAFRDAAGAGDLAAAHFDIVARTKRRLHAEMFAQRRAENAGEALGERRWRGLKTPTISHPM